MRYMLDTNIVAYAINKRPERVLQEAGIHVNVHYIPTYTFPYYRTHGYADTCCPNAEKIYGNILSIPMYYGITDEEIEYVIENVKKAAAGGK